MSKKIETVVDWNKFSKELEKYDCVVVMVKQDWCGHCQHLKPIFEEAFKKTMCNNIMSFYFDGEKSKNAIKKLPVEIQGYPTLLRYKKGKFDKQYEGKREELDLALFMCGKN